MKYTTPGVKEKGGKLADKPCPSCGLTLSAKTVTTHNLVSVDGSSSSQSVPFIDGDDITRRYIRVDPSKRILLDVQDWPYKPSSFYDAPKILIRQAGVGIAATLDDSGARCPQSVYMYRLGHEAIERGYTLEFLLGVLLSRTMAYYVFKKFAEVDPARAHAKVTHARLSGLPIPRLDSDNRDHAKIQSQVAKIALDLLYGRLTIGGNEDHRIDILLRGLWGLTPDDGALINNELLALPRSQALKDLFPEGSANIAGRRPGTLPIEA
ncbi:MAG TPA: TaqI-like C-terminal specificity domain-containing protein [Dehalococcoidia bacterium]|nr:TaqI-like C-terminal specificity domain-containing protein [Dehalococcoidia bacterium]